MNKEKEQSNQYYSEDKEIIEHLTKQLIHHYKETIEWTNENMERIGPNQADVNDIMLMTVMQICLSTIAKIKIIMATKGIEPGNDFSDIDSRILALASITRLVESYTDFYVNKQNLNENCFAQALEKEIAILTDIVYNFDSAANAYNETIINALFKN